MSDVNGNLLIVQTGLPTAVGNSILAGVIEQALADEDGVFDEILGAQYGARGLLEGRFLDLGGQKHKAIDGLRRTPGSALGTSCTKLSRSDAEAALEQLRAQGVRFLIVSGGTEAIESARALETVARSANYPLNVIAVPQSATNEINEGDHAPGYGSAARWVACAAREAALEASARMHDKPVIVLQVAGTQGWLAAAAGLGFEGSPGAHRIYFPERPIALDAAVEELREAVAQNGSCVVVMCEHSLSVAEGKPPCAGGMAATLKEKLEVEVGASLPGALQRLAHGAVKATDADEAFGAGQMAARQVKEMSGYAIILKRDPGTAYKASNGTAQLESFNLTARAVPAEYINEAGSGVTTEFLEYVRPLVGGALTEYVALESMAL